MFELILPKENFERIFESELLAPVIQLSRTINAIRANQRMYRRIDANVDFHNKKDRIEIILFHAALVWEGLKQFSIYRSLFKKLKTWNKQLEDIRELQKEINNKNSFTNLIIKRIRNKVVFHFDPKIIKDIADKFQPNTEIIFMSSKSGTKLDSVFNLADDFVLNFILKIIPIDETEIKKFDWFEDNLLRVSELLCDIFENLLLDLLKPYILWREN
ncbi:MAG: hypothetical protein ACTSO3_16850 [Candidatus Heimdallarchaeaceae archaeon]